MKKTICTWVNVSVISLIITMLSLARLSQFAKNSLIYGEKQTLFGATYMTMNNEFYEVIDEELRNEIEASGGYLITRDPQLSAERQILEIEEMISLGVEVLFVNPVDSTKLVNVLKKAREHGVTVIAIDTTVYDGEGFVDYSVVSDNYLAGQLCAKKMMAERDSARIVLLEHETAISAVDRIQGFKDAISGDDQYEIVLETEVEGQMEKSMAAVNEIIESQLSFDVVMALNDPSAIGCAAALRQSNMQMNHIMILGVDGSPEAKKLISEGYLSATVAQFPKIMAQKAVSAALQIQDGNCQISSEAIEVEMIDENNLDSFLLEGWQ